MFINMTEPQMAIQDGPEIFTFDPRSYHHFLYQQLCLQQAGLGLGLYDMANSDINDWSRGVQPKAERVVPDGNWFHGVGDEDFVLEDSYSDGFVGLNPVTGGHPGKTHEPHEPYVSHQTQKSDFLPSQSFTGRPLPENDILWPSYAVNEHLQSFTSLTPGWNQHGNSSSPYGYGNATYPDGLPNTTMACMPMANGLSELPSDNSSSVYNRLSSTGASDTMESMALTDNGQSSPWTPAARRSGHISPSTSFGTNSDVWAMGSSMVATVSPKLLRLNPSPSYLTSSSSESVQTSFLSPGEPEFPAAPAFQAGWVSGVPSSASASAMKPEPPAPRARRQLPDRSPHPRYVPILPHDPQHAKPKSRKSSQPKSKPNHATPVPSPPTPQSALGTEQDRSRKDEYLLTNKRAGMTYKEIRKQGNFAEAESTLRGRFRTLTKNKEARVRKPEWEEKDDRLLKKAVRKLAKGDDLKMAKIPWKLVGEYIVNHGGSYHFGNTTCRKRWDFLVEKGAGGS